MLIVMVSINNLYIYNQRNEYFSNHMASLASLFQKSPDRRRRRRGRPSTTRKTKWYTARRRWTRRTTGRRQTTRFTAAWVHSSHRPRRSASARNDPWSTPIRPPMLIDDGCPSSCHRWCRWRSSVADGGGGDDGDDDEERERAEEFLRTGSRHTSLVLTFARRSYRGAISATSVIHFRRSGAINVAGSRSCFYCRPVATNFARRKNMPATRFIIGWAIGFSREIRCHFQSKLLWSYLISEIKSRGVNHTLRCKFHVR